MNGTYFLNAVQILNGGGLLQVYFLFFYKNILSRILYRIKYILRLENKFAEEGTYMSLPETALRSLCLALWLPQPNADLKFEGFHVSGGIILCSCFWSP